MVERLQLQAGDQLVDLGTGPGTVVQAALPVLGPGGSAIGADLAERQLALARESLAAQRRQVRFVHDDVVSVDLGERTADGAALGFVLPYLGEPVRALREASRITKRGRRVAATAWGHPFFGTPGERLLAALERHDLPQVALSYATAPETLAALTFRAGLGDVMIEEHDLELGFPDFDAWWRFNAAFAFLVDLHAGGSETAAQVREELSTDERVLEADGAISCRMRVLLLSGEVRG